LVIFLIAGVAETHRAAFDLPEAESEFVAGYPFGIFGHEVRNVLRRRYLGITLVSALTVALFFGGWLGPWAPPLVLVFRNLCVNRGSSCCGPRSATAIRSIDASDGK